MIKLISESDLTEKGKANFNLPLFESQKLLPLSTYDRKLDICFNMDSFLNNINSFFLKDSLSESDKNQLISSILSIKDRLMCTEGPT